ncbi:hypothetical protein [Actinacidiphila acidipaludis]|uniref:Uncharacterized protein n=1 Tax=Actinacidiphila acidipaludis TaxID=2873382 RepID=A0ABS7QF88_9ACTN|nr:hypothetical protein [Streptomyces acidipaludis]MBY8881827.1 hypothetical protein [Streptomyces acidipaludis]
MNRRIPLPGHRRRPLLALGLAAACGLFVVPASHAQGAPPAAFTPTAAAHTAAAHCRVTLPGGLQATVTSDGTRLTDPAAAAGRTMLGFRDEGHQYLVPQDVAVHAATRSLAAYDTTALAARTCAGDWLAPAARPAAAAAAHRPYTMGRLTTHLINDQGRPAFQGLLFLVDADHTTYANQLFGVVNGSLRMAVPTGHYAAVYVDTSHITVAPDVTVGDGTSITLDARTSTHEIPVPATPRPATLTNTELSLYRSDGTPSGDDAGPVLQIQNMGSSPSGLTLNTTAPVSHGRFAAVTTTDLASPDGTQPYAYHLANSYDHLPSSYPASVAQSSLATVTRTYSAPAGATGTDLLVENVTPLWASTAGMQTATGFEFLTPGTVRTEYIGSSTGLNWRTQVEDEQTANTLTGADTVYRPGARLSETWEAGAPHPSVQLDIGNAAVYCGACASADTMVFAIGSDGDSSPGTIGLGFDETNSVSLTRDGTLLATGDDGLFEASVPVPAGRATYRLEQRTARNGQDLSPGTDTTWTFTADPGKGAALPDRVHCAGPVDSCAALPLLFASTSTDADLQHQVTPGPHTLGLTVTRQQYAAAAAVAGASLQVSYDGGTSWQSLRVTGDHGSYRAAYTVPAAAAGSTVSFRLAAWDSRGNRIDQVLPRAYRVR